LPLAFDWVDRTLRVSDNLPPVPPLGVPDPFTLIPCLINAAYCPGNP
jgi:hypothetical protein